LASSSEGGGIEKEDEDVIALRASVEALRETEDRIACMAGLASLQRAAAVRNGSSRRAMVGDV